MRNFLVLTGLIVLLLLTACSGSGQERSPYMGSVKQVATPIPTAKSAQTKDQKQPGGVGQKEIPLELGLDVPYLAMVPCDFAADPRNCGGDKPNPMGTPPRFRAQEPICILWRETGNPDNQRISMQVVRAGSIILSAEHEAFGHDACQALQLNALPSGDYKTTFKFGNTILPVTWSIADTAPSPYAGSDQKAFRNSVITVSGTWTDPAGSYDDNYKWSWDLNGDGAFENSGNAAYGETIVQTTTFANLGMYKLTFQVSDNKNPSASASVQIAIINQPPVAADQEFTTDEKTAVDLVLNAKDYDGDKLSFKVLDNPSHGVLNGTPPNLQYVPNGGSSVSDSFTFLANDGMDDSNVAKVSIVIKARTLFCPGSPPPQLTVGGYAYVTTNPPLSNRVREGPGEKYSVIDTIGPGKAVEVLEGPMCSDNWTWWKVRTVETGLVGWTVEGDGPTYWLVPCSSKSNCGVPSPPVTQY
jgi:hypothetical protein